MVDPILGSTAYTHHLAILDRNVEAAAIAAEQARRRYPTVHVIGGKPIDQMHIYTYGPGLA
jgi:hypothetical protein